jgi:hypothetical protein
MHNDHGVTRNGDDGRRIVTVTSAPGWSALFERGADHDSLGELRLVTLAAWALVDEGNSGPRLVGLVQRPVEGDEPAGSFAFADEHDGFAGYSNQGLKTKWAS